MAAELSREKCGEGSLQEKGGVHNIVLGYKVKYDDGSKAYKYRWYATGLSVKGNNLRKANQMLSVAYLNFNPYNLDISLDELLNEPPVKSDNENAENVIVSEIIQVEQIAPITFAEENHIAEVNDILFSDYMAQWLKEIQKNVGKSTFASYKLNVDKKVIPYFEEKGIYLNQLTSNDIHTFYKKMRNNGLKQTKKSLKRSITGSE